MTNTNLLKSKYIEKGYTQQTLSSEIGMSKQSFNRKLLNKSEFTVSEILAICNALEIKDKDSYFFA